MAEKVQDALDQMVAPLRDLMDRQIFSESEIKAIVSRRRESEYLLRRATARKADFLRYIQAEQELEELRAERTKKIQEEEKIKRRERRAMGIPHDDDGENEEAGRRKQRNKGGHIGDAHVLQHIHLIFTRALRKFRSDLSLHLQLADHCKKHKQWRKLGNVYAEALQVFPTQDGLWIEAASHEFFGPARNIRNARVLMQRGIRRNGTTSHDLWVEYFTLEMHFALTLRSRRQVLMGEGATVPDEEEDDDDDDDDEIRGAKEDSDDSSWTKIPLIVYKNAIRSIPDSVSFRLRFLDVCHRFPDTKLIVSTIQASLERDFSSTPEAWIARAMYAAETGAESPQEQLTLMDKAAIISDEKDALESHTADNDEQHGGNNDKDGVGEERSESERPKKKQRKDGSPVIAVLSKAIEEVQTDDMFLQAFRFARSQLRNQEIQGNHSEMKESVEFIEKLIQKASVSPSCEFVLEHVEYLEDQKTIDEAAIVLESYCTNGSKDCAPVAAWFKWAELKMSRAVFILERACKGIPMSSLDHLKALLQLVGAILQHKKLSTKMDTKLTNSFQSILLLAPGFPDLLIDDSPFKIKTVADACFKYLQHQIDNGATGVARNAYQSILFSSSIIKLREENASAVRSLVDACIAMEKKSEDKRRLLRLYDKALELFGGTGLEAMYKRERDLVVYR